MPKHNTPKLERFNVRQTDKLVLDAIRGQLARMLGRPLNQADFAGLLAKHSEKIRDVIAENEKVE